jgi:hypothetical protein
VSPHPATVAQVGEIPNSEWTDRGLQLYAPPADTQPAISQSRAEAIALDLGGKANPYAGTGQPLRIKQAYLVMVEHINTSGPLQLGWVVDISPPCPFGSGVGGVGGGLAPIPPSASVGTGPSHAAATPSVVPSLPPGCTVQGAYRFAFVLINAMTGAGGTTWSG